MGPFASQHFHQLLLNHFIGKINLPEIFMDTISIEDFTTDISKIPAALEVLTNTISHFEALGINLIVMPCNTAHILHPQLLPLTSAEFPNILDLVIDEVSDNNFKKVLLLASPNTIKSNIYSQRFQAHQIQVATPSASDQHLIEKAIKHLIQGKVITKDIDNINQIISKHSRQVDAVILGCTELSLISNRLTNINNIDSLQILANHVISTVKC